LKSNPATAPQTPRHAATVLLLREQSSAVEVLVIRRHANLAFMGGMWVFPGGALAEADMSPGALACIPDRSKARCIQFQDLHGAALGRTQCFGLAIAAYRETFEETGVLLATDAHGNHCSDDLLIRLQAQRRAIAADPALFAGLLTDAQLHLDVDRLLYWAHWITPSNAPSPRRFDTRFFAIVVPAGQTAAIDTIEAVDHAWMTPAALVAAAMRGEMPVSQPTLYNLMELDNSLREHGALAPMLKSEADREIAPVLPKMIREAQTAMVLPWDPEYAVLPGEGAPPGLEYPKRLHALPSRMTMLR
jgi:8-oxo-dGTP pyrophosphatase MutT (NUDIX family)